MRRERIFIELMTSDRKLKASREGSHRRKSLCDSTDHHYLELQQVYFEKIMRRKKGVGGKEVAETECSLHRALSTETKADSGTSQSKSGSL